MIRWKRPDGGKDSGVKCWGIEIKWLFSIVLLRFEPNERENFHSHAFNAITLWLKGNIEEYVMWNTGVVHKDGTQVYFENMNKYKAYDLKKTPRTKLHNIQCSKTAWALSFRGPWHKEWTELTPDGKLITLTKGRKVV